MARYIAVDIGGTKCAVSRFCDGVTAGGPPVCEEKIRFETPDGYEKAIAEIVGAVRRLCAGFEITAAGISCGGPLNSRRGVLLSPPNLPGWDNVDIVTPVAEAAGVPAFLQNDANAGALAEWLWGAGQGFDNIVFLTFGTGMGGGLILDGRLYVGTNDMGGEVGHLRLAPDGPVGFGKAGSFEGFCSGGGMARLAEMRLAPYQAGGGVSSLSGADITAKLICEAAAEGDDFAASVIAECGERLGQGIALLVDILNPQRVIIGSMYIREPRFAPIVARVLEREAISHALEVCEVVGAGLGEKVGDFAAVAAALYGIKFEMRKDDIR